ncbi:hypothetical protein RAH42_09480 [Pyramidobacter sp. YE332]|uniref:ABC-three component system protein n=1 Tax=Pyramidobacter sp. YE332 TaxID=3068894 RepID=UPI00294ACD5D|nr:ABC-three component system protein [Pyramidobacter sp. YE332]WOL39371.1 hypothetical protein RAH42_09480 [Pyramidobacter sp. YE332]
MVSHNTSGQMLGYLYQVRYALNLLMSSDDPSYQISIEKFDDIAFDKEGTPVQLIQAKHHTTPASLTDVSTDLWRTLNVWFDAISADFSLLDHTDFVIITTAGVPDNSAAEAIQNQKYQKAYDRLNTVAEDSTNKTNAKFYNKFRQTDKNILMNLVKRIKIISSASDIVNVEKDIQKQMRYSCKPEHVSMATERIEGWWFRESVQALSSVDPTITTQRQLHSKIYEITRQYGDDNLPIEFWDLDEIEEAELDPKDRIFLEQLRLLQYKSRSLRMALQDYYKASMQRSSWLRQGLVFTNELDTYEHRLKDAWEHAFADMEEELKDYENPTEQEKIKAGKELYRRVMDYDIRIRSRVDASYVMQGTYHRLANNLIVGWHVDFFEKLKHLLEGVNEQ